MITLFPDEFVNLSMDRYAGILSDGFDMFPDLPWSMKIDTVAYLMAIQRIDPGRLSFDPNLKYLHAGSA